MQHEHVARRIRIGIEQDVLRNARVRNAEHREAAFGKVEALRLPVDHMNAQRREEAKDASRFGGARRIMVSRHHHHDAVRQCLRETGKLGEGVQNGRVGRPHVVKDVARQND